jgi:hypothetical protein
LSFKDSAERQAAIQTQTRLEQSKNRGIRTFQLRMTGTTQSEMDKVTRLKGYKVKTLKGGMIAARG